MVRVGVQLLPQQPRESPSIPVCVALAALITWRHRDPTGICPSFSGGVAIVSLKRGAPSSAIHFRGLKPCCAPRPDSIIPCLRHQASYGFVARFGRPRAAPLRHCNGLCPPDVSLTPREGFAAQRKIPPSRRPRWPWTPGAVNLYIEQASLSTNISPQFDGLIPGKVSALVVACREWPTRNS